MDIKPRVFIGSSSEGLALAEAMFSCLTREREPALNKLLQAAREPERLERGAPSEAGERDQELAPLEAVNRPTKRSR